MSRVALRLAIIDAAKDLEAAGIPTPRIDAELLAAHVVGVPRGRLGLVPLVDPSVIETFRRFIDRRLQRIPLQHIIGTAQMGEIEVEVGPGVFVPRPETELLLVWALAYLRGVDHDRPVVLDLCSGSGALALAIARARPDAVVHAVELDTSALAWGRRNATRQEELGETPIRLHHGDVTAPDLLAELDGTVDVIVANPPYIPVGTALDPEVADHDPSIALFGGIDGLSVIGPMVANVARWLRPGGAVAVEHDDSHGARVAELFAARSVFEAVAEHRDLADRPRFVVAARR